MTKLILNGVDLPNIPYLVVVNVAFTGPITELTVTVFVNNNPVPNVGVSDNAILIPGNKLFNLVYENVPLLLIVTVSTVTAWVERTVKNMYNELG